MTVVVVLDEPWLGDAFLLDRFIKMKWEYKETHAFGRFDGFNVTFPGQF